jgi:signal transduction histidine kinase
MGAAHLPVRRSRRPETVQAPSAGLIARPGATGERRSNVAADQTLALRTIHRFLQVGAAVVLLEAILVWLAWPRSWGWLVAAALSLAAAGLLIYAGLRAKRLQLAWFAAGGGCLSLVLGFAGRGLAGTPAGVPAVLVGREDSGFHGAVVFLLFAALALIQGEGIWLRRAKLTLDAAILVMAPVVASLPQAERLAGSPDLERIWSGSVLYCASYGAVCYALVIATRRRLLVEPGAPESLLTLGAVGLAGAAVLEAVQLLLLLPLGSEPGLGQTAWLAGSALLALAGWRAARQERGLIADLEQDAKVGEDSRLRLVPAAIAGVVVAVTAIQQAGSRQAPSAAFFFGSSSLFWLIVSRLLVTLAENRRLVRGMQSADRSQIAIRDLGLALNFSLEPARVWQYVCRTGQAVLGADSTVLWLVDRSARELEGVEAVGGRRVEILSRRISMEDYSSLAVRVTRSRAPELIRHAASAGRSHQRLTVLRGTQCLLAVPLRRGQRAIGALVFAHFRDPTAFRQEDIALAEVVANQAAVALQNAELFQEERRGRLVMSALYEYARACDGSASSEEVARELLETLHGKVEFEQGTVLLADGGMLVSARGLVMRCLEGQSEPSLDVAPARLSPLAIKAFRTREAARALPGEPDFRPQLEQSRVQVAVPLVLRDHAIGVVELESASAAALSDLAETLVSSLARHAALAIDNLRLEEDTREVATLKKLDRLKTELLGTVSHELRTPLAAIKGYATTLLQHQRMNGELRREFLGVIDSESDRLEELINNLLDMSRLEAGVLRVDPAPVKLGRVVQNAVERAQHLTADHQIVLDWRGDPWISADVPRVIQVLTNLLNNAIKYSPDGGLISVSGRTRGGQLQVSVTDRGVGIPPREVDKIFDRFHRVEGDLARRVSGTGLGLAICRGLIEAHGGRIWVDSKPGVGSTFTFTLPTCKPGVS